MNIEITLHSTLDYYQESYSQWLRYRSKFRKWQPIIGYGLIAIGLMLLVINYRLSPFALVAVLFGLSNLFDFYYEKHKWFKSVTSNKMLNTKVIMRFEDEFIQTSSEFAESKLNWDFFCKVIETPKGLFLIPQNGISVYISKQTFHNQQDIATILDKLTSIIQKQQGKAQ